MKRAESSLPICLSLTQLANSSEEAAAPLSALTPGPQLDKGELWLEEPA